jgi:hypothetical protein
MKGDLSDGRVRLGGPVAKRIRRAELEEIIEDHLSRYPGSWFTAVDLARVIRERLGDPVPPSHGAYHYGRSNVVTSILRQLAGSGRVVVRPHAERRAARQWRCG